MSQYTGRLTTSQAAAAIEAAIRTARSLLSDAELLLSQNRWARATALAILAIEEAGKVEIIRAILLARNESELQTEWRAYRSHAKKNVGWIFFKLVKARARKLEHFRPMFDARSDHGRFIDTVKQDCFYSNLTDSGTPILPDQRADSELATSILTIAKLLVKEGPSPMTSDAELQLWVKHLGPVWKGRMDEMKRALAACYAEAEANGILQGTGTAAAMLNFLFEDSSGKPN